MPDDLTDGDDPPENPYLAAAMKQLMNGRSIGQLRADMAAKGVKIGGGTIHRAVKGKLGNRLESLEKLAQFFDVTVDQLLQPAGMSDHAWPFSLEMFEEVKRLDEATLELMEQSMWTFLRKKMPADLHFERQGEREPSRPESVSPVNSNADEDVGNSRHRTND